MEISLITINVYQAPVSYALAPSGGSPKEDKVLPALLLIILSMFGLIVSPDSLKEVFECFLLAVDFLLVLYDIGESRQRSKQESLSHPEGLFRGRKPNVFL